MPTYHEFSADSINQALAAAGAHNETFGVAGAPAAVGADMNVLAGGGEFAIAAQCISIKVENHKVCLKLPLGIGQVCLPVPAFVPNGKVVSACLTICTTWGFPTGVKVTVSVGSTVIITKKFGKC